MSNGIRTRERLPRPDDIREAITAYQAERAEIDAEAAADEATS